MSSLLLGYFSDCSSLQKKEYYEMQIKLILQNYIVSSRANITGFSKLTRLMSLRSSIISISRNRHTIYGRGNKKLRDYNNDRERGRGEGKKGKKDISYNYRFFTLFQKEEFGRF